MKYLLFLFFPFISIKAQTPIIQELKDNEQKLVFNGLVWDKKTKKTVEARIEVIDFETKDTIGIYKSDSINGKYTLNLLTGKKYVFNAINEDGYFYYSSHKFIPLEPSNKDFKDTIFMEKMIICRSFPINSILFDFNKTSFKLDSEKEIKKIKWVLLNHPALTICLIGHTDSDGSSSYNLNLSKARAKSVRNYLIKAGTAPKRLSIKACGESKPIVPNDTTQNKQFNRRVEFEVME